jgi:hypothetical protein
MELPRDSKGIRLDVRGNRDLVFNNWHRKNIGRIYYVTDFDFLEYRFENRKLILKAIYEVKEWHVNSPKYIEENANFKAVKELCRLAKLPFYVVWYLKDENTQEIIKFKIWDVFNKPKNVSKEQTPEQMKNFIENL